jgi:hypothetical protein
MGIPSKEKHMTQLEILQNSRAALNTKADEARARGDAATYHQLVDQMIELEDAFLDAGGELPPVG